MTLTTYSHKLRISHSSVTSDFMLTNRFFLTIDDNAESEQTADLVSGGSASFNGFSQFLRAPINVDPSTMPSMTWGAWVMPTSTNAVRAVLSTDNCCYDRDIDIDSRGGSLSWSAFTGSVVVGSGVPIFTNEWSFLAVAYDQQAQTMSFYVNNNAPIVAQTDFGLAGNNNFIDIAHNPGFGEYFAGRIDNVFVYNETLNTAQISAVKSGNFSVSLDEPNLLILMLIATGAAMMTRRPNVKKIQLFA